MIMAKSMPESMFHQPSEYSDDQKPGCSQANRDFSALTQLIRIETLLVITALMLVFLGVFGLFRRRCGNRALALVAFGAYTLSPAIIAYTLGLIQSAPFCSSNFPVWAAYLVVFLGSADSYTAHCIEDIEQWKSFNIGSAATCFMASWMIASYVTDKMSPLCAVFLFVILFVKVDERARALMLASNSVMEKKYKLIADYMSTEHKCSSDPTTMSGYKYLVRLAEEAKVHSLCSTAIFRRKASPWSDGKAPHYRQKLEGKTFVTVEEIWSCEGRLLKASGDPEGRLKDLCLSFSLFKFICLRFAGYSLPREAHEKLQRLIEHMLSEENGYERVFRVIEVELAFLFDLFYTKYPVNLSPRRSFFRLLLLHIMVAAALILIFFSRTTSWGELMLLRHSFLDKTSRFYSAFFYWRHVAVSVTILLMMSSVVIELAYFGTMIFSEWAKVTYICKYVQNEWWKKNRCAAKLIEIMCRVWLLKPWGRQLRQYSLLEAYSYSPRSCIHNRLTAAYLDPRRDGQKQLAPANLSKQVTKAIARSLGENSSGNLQKGKASLTLNGVLGDLSWACDLESTTHVIMVWHIATTFCEYGRPRSGPQSDNFGIATELSKYLAYLVAFAPRLLPGHPCRTEYIFGRAVSEARELLEGYLDSMGERIQKLQKVADDREYNETIVGRGTRLGMWLMNTVADEERIWKVLADFWAEMMLYVAPSNNTAAHANYLTTGGEFVTHVWVLVTHVGFTRDPPSGEQHGDPEWN